MAEALDRDLQYGLGAQAPAAGVRGQQALNLAQQWLEAMAQEILRASGSRLWD